MALSALRVLEVDNHVLVVEKPAGLPVVPDESGDPSLLDEARAWVERTFHKPGRAFLGVVHRLDRPVSGVVVFARTSKAAARLTRAFQERRVDKLYWGVAHRAPRPPRGELEQWLVKDRARNTVRVQAGPGGEAKRASTAWRVLSVREEGARRVLVELRPRTGRPHQLRVAMASLNAPLAGDLRYGAQAPLPDRSVALHARELAFPHPTRDEELRLWAPVPHTAIWEGFEDAPPGPARGS